MSISRKDFLKKVGLLSVAGVGTAALAACGGGGSEKPAEPKKMAADPCKDTSGVPAAELQKRTTFKYVDASADPAKHCSGCALYKAPADGGCGGCTLFAGPVTQNGYCTAWAAKPEMG
ncbi:hypothetical protein EP331_11995 [bacterium]|nr:MAG: hypothetical protein EP331_11995 [bacterium]